MKLHTMFTLALILLSCMYQGSVAQDGGGLDCPVISVSGPDTSSMGRRETYKASIRGGERSVKPTFKWTVSAGKITEGQGTSEVSVDAEGNNSITVTVEVVGYPASCQNKASYGRVVDRAMTRKFDEYSSLKLAEEHARLDQFAAQLQKEPGARGYILAYDEMGSRRNKARERGEKARTYLIKERGFKEEQIVVVDGGRREKRAIELFIVPSGAVPPMGLSTANP